MHGLNVTIGRVPEYLAVLVHYEADFGHADFTWSLRSNARMLRRCGVLRRFAPKLYGLARRPPLGRCVGGAGCYGRCCILRCFYIGRRLVVLFIARPPCYSSMALNVTSATRYPTLRMVLDFSCVQ